MRADGDTLEVYKPYISIIFIGYQKLDEGWRYPNLSAPFWRLYWNDSPGAVLVHGKKKIAIHPSLIYLVAPETACSTFSPPVGPGHFYVHFFCQPPHALLCVPEVLTFPAGPETLALVGEAAAMASAGTLGAVLTLRALSLVAAALCKIPHEKLAAPLRLDPRVEKSMEFLMGTYAYRFPPSNAHLAARVGMSVNGFLRLFKQNMRMSPQVYLMKRRIDEARILLRVTDLGIKEIAEKLGFHDRNHFSRVFKKECGTSPGKSRGEELRPLLEP